jgi:hypothetical protein
MSRAIVPPRKTDANAFFFSTYNSTLVIAKKMMTKNVGIHASHWLHVHRSEKSDPTHQSRNNVTATPPTIREANFIMLV